MILKANTKPILLSIMVVSFKIGPRLCEWAYLIGIQILSYRSFPTLTRDKIPTPNPTLTQIRSKVQSIVLPLKRSEVPKIRDSVTTITVVTVIRSVSEVTSISDGFYCQVGRFSIAFTRVSFLGVFRFLFCC